MINPVSLVRFMHVKCSFSPRFYVVLYFSYDRSNLSSPCFSRFLQHHISPATTSVPNGFTWQLQKHFAVFQVVSYGTGIKHAQQCIGQTVDESAVMSPHIINSILDNPIYNNQWAVKLLPSPKYKRKRILQKLNCQTSSHTRDFMSSPVIACVSAID